MKNTWNLKNIRSLPFKEKFQVSMLQTLELQQVKAIGKLTIHGVTREIEYSRNTSCQGKHNRLEIKIYGKA